MTPRALFLLTAYSNMDEVDDFVDHVRGAFPPGGVAFSICDNSPISSSSRHHGDQDVVSAARPDNPGYLDGGLEALQRYQSQNSRTPEWIFLSNTDLRFESKSVLEHLLTSYDADVPHILAPRITEGDARIEKNPHVKHRRARGRLMANRVMTANSALAVAYLSLSVLRREFSVRVPRVPLRTSSSVAAPAGSEMYSPYGALVLFSRAFFEHFCLPAHVPLLAEEYAIAEAASSANVPILFEPSVHVHHVPHTTTGPDVTLRRARMLTTAFRYIADSARLRPSDT